MPRGNSVSAADTAKGAYVLADSEKAEPAVILMGTGSEVAICLEAFESLRSAGIPARVVSMPCWEWFEEQPESYRNAVLPANTKLRVGVEAGIRQGWDRYIGANGIFVGMTGFGASAPAQQLYEKFGITAKKITSLVQKALR